ncbi:hypothetical protein PLICRDRAFT_225726 [Plicaturopsis crispa FD-325 SS-3]|nr:hypothetical protein PLICRDRAFT_225726 [Plicaturopsis crispa FD-325 SS-3]
MSSRRYLPFPGDAFKIPWFSSGNNNTWTGHALPELPMNRTDDSETDVVDKATQQANSQLVQAWMDRLQVLSVLTTFFASMDGSLLALAIEGPPTAATKGKSKAHYSEFANACISGALIFHIAAAVISFVASFILLHYRIKDAKTVHDPPSDDDGTTRSPSTSFSGGRPQPDDIKPLTAKSPIPTSPRLIRIEPMVFIEKTQAFDWFKRSKAPEPPLRLLTRCHTLCISLCGIGFVLAIVGVLAFSWTSLSKGVSAFSTVCVVLCTGAGLYALR